jgi:hypothetical protein
MPRRRPVHPVRLPLAARVPVWSCSKRQYRSQAEADAALGEIWAHPTKRVGASMEAHSYRCPRHEGREVWHLTSQDRDQEGRTA